MSRPTSIPRRRSRASGATARRPFGMTLIEVLVALLIFSFGLLGLIGLQGRAHTYATSAEDSNRAALLANEIVSTIVLTPKADGTIDTNHTPTEVAWSASAALSLPNGSVKFGALAAGGRQLPITVYWKPPTAPTGAASNAYATQAVLP